jgi:hypothetical protein
MSLPICCSAQTKQPLDQSPLRQCWLEMFQQAIFALLHPLNSDKPFFTIFTMLLTPGGLPPVVLFHLGLCGTVFPATSPPGPRVSGMPAGTWSPNPSPSPNGVFLTSMLIWWGPCCTVIILITFLLLLVIHPNGWTQSLFQKRSRRHAQKL